MKFEPTYKQLKYTAIGFAVNAAVLGGMLYYQSQQLKNNYKQQEPVKTESIDSLINYDGPR